MGAKKFDGLFSRKYTIIFVPDVTGEFKRVSFPRFVIKVLAVSVFVFFVGLSYLGHRYYVQSAEVAELESLRKSNYKLTMDLQKISNRIKEIDSQLARVEQFDRKLRVITAMGNNQGKDGKEKFLGGSNMENYSISARNYTQSLLESTYQDVEILKNMAESQELSLFELDNFFKGQSSLLLHTPSIWPTKGFVTSTFGYRRSPFTNLREMHEGLDVATQIGSPIISPANGVVIRATYRNGYGNVVEIDHGYGVVTRFAHNSRNLVKAGQLVKRGDVVAEVGSTGNRSTGPHMHYEVWLNGVPVNPYRYILED